MPEPRANLPEINAARLARLLDTSPTLTQVCDPELKPESRIDALVDLAQSDLAKFDKILRTERTGLVGLVMIAEAVDKGFLPLSEAKEAIRGVNINHVFEDLTLLDVIYTVFVKLICLFSASPRSRRLSKSKSSGTPTSALSDETQLTCDLALTLWHGLALGIDSRDMKETGQDLFKDFFANFLAVDSGKFLRRLTLEILGYDSAFDHLSVSAFTSLRVVADSCGALSEPEKSELQAICFVGLSSKSQKTRHLALSIAMLTCAGMEWFLAEVTPELLIDESQIWKLIGEQENVQKRIAELLDVALTSEAYPSSFVEHFTRIACHLASPHISAVAKSGAAKRLQVRKMSRSERSVVEILLQSTFSGKKIDENLILASAQIFEEEQPSEENRKERFVPCVAFLDQVAPSISAVLVAKLCDILTKSYTTAVNLHDSQLTSELASSMSALKPTPSLFFGMLHEILKKSTTFKKARKRTQSGEVIADEPSESETRPVLMLWLSLLRRAELPKSDDTRKLTDVLFTALEQLLTAETTPNPALTHSLLAALLHLFKLVGNEFLKKTKIPIDLLVTCIRTSSDKQVHQVALELLIVAAPLANESLLHHVVTIFTFVGGNLFRHDDGYTFDLIHQIVYRLIPILLKGSSGKTGFSAELAPSDKTMVEICRIFVSAFSHIPEHRRLSLFAAVADATPKGQSSTVPGRVKTAWILVALLIELEVVKGHRLRQPAHRSEVDRLSIMEFALRLVAKLTAPEILQCCCCLVNLFSILPFAKPDGHTEESALSKATLSTKIVFDWKTNTDKQLIQFRYMLIQMCELILSGSDLVQKLAKIDNIEKECGETLDKLTENILEAQEVKGQPKEPSLQQQKYGKACLAKAKQCAQSVFNLMPVATVITAISSLIASEKQSMRHCGLELLNSTLQQDPSPLTDKEVPKLLEILAFLLKKLNSIHEDVVPESQEIHAIIFSLKLLSKQLTNFGEVEKLDSLLPLLISLFDKALLDQGQGQHLAAHVILAIGETTSSISKSARPDLAKSVADHGFIERLCSQLSIWSRPDCSEVLAHSLVSAIDKILKALPVLIPPHLNALIDGILALDTRKWTPQLTSKISRLEQQIAAQPPDLLLPVLEHRPSALFKDNPQGIEPITRLLTAHLRHHGSNREALRADYLATEAIFLELLNLRDLKIDNQDLDVEKVEASVLNAFVTLSLKLTETQLRGTLEKVTLWAFNSAKVQSASDSSNFDRLITLFRLHIFLAERLRLLYINFAPDLFRRAAALLADFSLRLQTAPVSAKMRSRKSKSAGSSLQLNEALTAVFDWLTAFFKTDPTGFMNKERLESIAEPLADQLENEVTDGLEIRVTEHLIKTFEALVECLEDEPTVQTLLDTILAKLQHPSPTVRLLALKSIEAIVGALPDDLMHVVQEQAHLIVELFEDSSTQVETMAKRVVAMVQKRGGEVG